MFTFSQILLQDFFPIPISCDLPIKGVALLLGNDIAGGRVVAPLEVLDIPKCVASETFSDNSLYPSCAVTHAQAKKNQDLSIADSLLQAVFSGDTEPRKSSENLTESLTEQTDIASSHADQPCPEELALPVIRKSLSEAQETNPSLQRCLASAVSNDRGKDRKVTYYFDRFVDANVGSLRGMHRMGCNNSDYCSCCLSSTDIILGT